MPRKGYTSTGHNSLPDETIKQIDALMKDPAFIRDKEDFRGTARRKQI